MSLLLAETDLMGQLAGRWQFSRSVSDGATMTGQAVFSPIAPDTLRYIEDGTMMLSGKPYRFERAYLYQVRSSGLTVFFDETPLRLFQDIALREDGASLSGQGQHDCAPDRYVSSYRFDLPGVFEITHQVTGPRKAYTIVTHYRR